jgi:predicted Rossmann fold flavoprotein
VTLKREETGKLFPTTDDAHTVLDALLDEARGRGVEVLHPHRVVAIERTRDGFAIGCEVTGPDGRTFTASRVVVATGGKSIPKSGSDGFGYELVRTLGHSITSLVTPGLVPLLLPRDHFLCALSGVTLDATIELRSGTGKRIVSFTNSTLLTHFGLSGPSVLDISRYYLYAVASDPNAALFANWLPGTGADALDRDLRSLQAKTIGGFLREQLPERLVRALCEHAGVDPSTRGNELTREGRRSVTNAVCNLALPITGSRGYNFAEVTSGGVPLSELHLATLESRTCSGLYLCGEICDVDGRIGGFNFQWAWSSGFVAGTAAATD